MLKSEGMGNEPVFTVSGRRNDIYIVAISVSPGQYLQTFE